MSSGQGNPSLSVRIPQEAHDQISDLAKVYNVNRAAVVAMAVARMHHEDALLNGGKKKRRKKPSGSDHSRV